MAKHPQKLITMKEKKTCRSELIRRNEYCIGLLFGKDQRCPAVQDLYHDIMNRIIELENEHSNNK